MLKIRVVNIPEKKEVEFINNFDVRINDHRNSMRGTLSNFPVNLNLRSRAK
jgi:hypothetical protein